MLDVHGAIDAPMTLGGSYRYPEDRDHGDRRRRDAAAARRSRARRRASSPTRASATITSDRHSPGHRRRSPATCAPTSPTARGAARCTSTRRTPRSCRTQVPEAWRVSGPLTADAILGGTFDNFRLDTTINGTRADLGRPADRSRHGQGDGHRRSDRRDVAAAAPGRGLSRRPRSLRVGDRRLRRRTSKAIACRGRARCCRRTTRRRSSRCSSTAPAPSRIRRARRASTSR